MKTIKQWLSEIEDNDVREKALANMEPKYAEWIQESLPEAIKGAFFWKRTPEGHLYWEQIVSEIKSSEVVPYHLLD